MWRDAKFWAVGCDVTHFGGAQNLAAIRGHTAHHKQPVVKHRFKHTKHIINQKSEFKNVGFNKEKKEGENGVIHTCSAHGPLSGEVWEQ